MLVVATGMVMTGTLQGTTICTEFPTWIDQVIACPAPVLENHVTTRTDDVVSMDPLSTTRAVQPVLEFLKQAFLFKRSFIRLGESLAWPEDEIEQKPEDVEHQHQRRGKDVDVQVRRAGTNIVVGPDNRAEPQCHEVRAAKGNDELNQGAERWHLITPTPRSGARPLSIALPGALESSQPDHPPPRSRPPFNRNDQVTGGATRGDHIGLLAGGLADEGLANR